MLETAVRDAALATRYGEVRYERGELETKKKQSVRIKDQEGRFRIINVQKEGIVVVILTSRVTTQ